MVEPCGIWHEGENKRGDFLPIFRHLSNSREIIRNSSTLWQLLSYPFLYVIKKVKSSSSPSQLATFSDFSVPSELWDALRQWSPQSYLSLKLITTSLQRDNRMIDSGVKWPLLVLVCDISRASRSFFLQEAILWVPLYFTWVTINYVNLALPN